MSLVLIGLNHKTAPVEVRERFAVAPARLGEAVAQLARSPGVSEAFLLSTCNRVEALAAASDSNAVKSFFQSYCGARLENLNGYLYERREREAVEHLFQVACSLDSMIVGEPQILGQVKEAYATARAAGALGPELEALLARALFVAKRVRTETAIGMSAVSVASAAVALAKEIFGTLAGKQVFLVGAGKMSELVARQLVAEGAGAVFVANRTHARAVELAAKFGGQALRFEELYETADRADIVIASTGAPHAIFRREHGERFLQRRRHRPMFFIDIAVPRDVDPALNQLDGIFVYDIDDLQSVVQSNRVARTQEMQRAREIVAEEVARFQARQQGRQAAPTITSLQAHLEAIRRSEVERVRARLGSLTPEQEAALEQLTRGIINKVLHTPAQALKAAAGEEQGPRVIELVQRIFNLNPNLNPSLDRNLSPNISPRLDPSSPPEKAETTPATKSAKECAGGEAAGETPSPRPGRR